MSFAPGMTHEQIIWQTPLAYLLWIIHAGRKAHGETMMGRNDLRGAELTVLALRRHIASLSAT